MKIGGGSSSGGTSYSTITEEDGYLTIDATEATINWATFYPGVAGPGGYSAACVLYGARIKGAGGQLLIDTDPDNLELSFYGASPIPLQTGVAVTAAAIHAALVNLGLIAP